MTRFKSFDEAAEKSHPNESVYHEITWWIEKELTFDEWVKLDDRMSEVLYDIVGDKFSGVAGPIPGLGLHEQARALKEQEPKSS